MGNSDKILIPFYKKEIRPIINPTALLGFSNNNIFYGDLYDRSINGWEINSNWNLPKKYNTIICTRCAYFSKNPFEFMSRCHSFLNKNGFLYVDWGIGDHWRFRKFKVGWVKDNEHEWAYDKDNLLWSFIWDDSFESCREYISFSESVKTKGYTNLKESIKKEIPYILNIKDISNYFSVSYVMINIEVPFLQLYVLLKCKK